MPPKPIDWNAILKKYSHPSIPHAIRKDIGALVGYARTMHQHNNVLAEELTGAKQTMLALCRAVGTIEIPFVLIDTLDPRDQIKVEDVKRGEMGLFKQFSYVAFSDPTVN